MAAQCLAPGTHQTAGIETNRHRIAAGPNLGAQGILCVDDAMIASAKALGDDGCNGLTVASSPSSAERVTGIDWSRIAAMTFLQGMLSL